MFSIPHLLGFTLATSPMSVVFEAAEPGLRVWWTEGDLIVAPPAGDPRPALRPLAGLAQMHLTEEMTGWHPLGPDCSADASPEFSLEGAKVQAHWVPHESSPSVELRTSSGILLSATLKRPARPCAIAAADVDKLAGLELLLLWEMTSQTEPIRGLTVLRIPPVVP